MQNFLKYTDLAALAALSIFDIQCPLFCCRNRALKMKAFMIAVLVFGILCLAYTLESENGMCDDHRKCIHYSLFLRTFQYHTYVNYARLPQLTFCKCWGIVGIFLICQFLTTYLEIFWFSSFIMLGLVDGWLLSTSLIFV